MPLPVPARCRLGDSRRNSRSSIGSSAGPQCGRECRLCETKCTVGRSTRSGRINPNECVLCLRCQVIMGDNAQCPVLKRRARAERGLPYEFLDQPRHNKSSSLPGNLRRRMATSAATAALSRRSGTAMALGAEVGHYLGRWHPATGPPHIWQGGSASLQWRRGTLLAVSQLGADTP